MRIRIWIADAITGNVIKQLGTCLTDNPARALQMRAYADAETKMANKGFATSLCYEDITNPSASALGSIKSSKKSKSSRANGKLGGRPKSKK